MWRAKGLDFNPQHLQLKAVRRKVKGKSVIPLAFRLDRGTIDQRTGMTGGSWLLRKGSKGIFTQKSVFPTPRVPPSF